MGMVSEKATKRGVFLGTKTMKGKPWVYLGAEGPEIHKIQVLGTLMGGAMFGEMVTVACTNLETKFQSFENYSHCCETLAMKAEDIGARKAA